MLVFIFFTIFFFKKIKQKRKKFNKKAALYLKLFIEKIKQHPMLRNFLINEY